MRLFAIADLHLPGGSDNKAMDVFGDHWRNHTGRIEEYWRDTVTEQDVVLLPGDISWAMRLEEAAEDIARIAALPGRKVMLRGNHDYWWNSIGRVRAMLPPGLFALQNDSIVLGPWVILGSRGWTCPGSGTFDPEDEKIYLREGQRLALSVQHADRHPPELRRVGMMHFPPFNDRREPSLFTDLFESRGVGLVVYGHLHGVGPENVFEGPLRGVTYRMVACDHLGFKPLLLDEG